MSVLFFNNEYFPNVKSGSDFDQESSFHHEEGVAFSNKSGFFASGLNHGGSLHCLNASQIKKLTLKEWVTRSFGDNASIEAKIIPGNFYKRIYRPSFFTASPIQIVPKEKLTSAIVSLRILLNKLANLFETIEPTETNLSTYGHKIREVLLLACMEVESSWTAVLKENQYSVSGRLTTKDYVKLALPMFLDGYELPLNSYPHITGCSPFKDWKESNPTVSLIWYNAYNKTKHNREENLKFATLFNTINAVAAAVVMFHAQFGPRKYWEAQNTQSMPNIFGLVTVELAKYKKNYYLPAVEIQDDSSQLIFKEWTATNYPF